MSNLRAIPLVSLNKFETLINVIPIDDQLMLIKFQDQNLNKVSNQTGFHLVVRKRPIGDPRAKSDSV